MVDGRADDSGDAALGETSDQALDVERTFAGEYLVYAFFEADFFHGLLSSERREEEEHIVAVFVWLCAKAFGRTVDDRFQLVLREHDCFGFAVDLLLEQLIDVTGQRSRAGFWRFEQDVATVDVRMYVLIAGGLEAGLEIGHAHFVIATDINAAKQGDVFSHKLIVPKRKS